MGKTTRVVMWCFLGVAVLWGTAALIMNSDGSSIDAFLLYAYGGIAFFFAAVTFGVVCIVSATRRRERLMRVFPLPYLLLIAVLALVFVGVSLNGAFWLRFEMSRGALEAATAQVQAGAKPKTPVRIGFFRVREIDRAGDSVRFIVGESLLDEVGVAYSPSGEPPVVGEDSYTHLTGDWWIWDRSW